MTRPTGRRMAANPISVLEKRRVGSISHGPSSDEAFDNFAQIGFTAVKAYVADGSEMRRTTWDWSGSYGLAPLPATGRARCSTRRSTSPKRSSGRRSLAATEA